MKNIKDYFGTKTAIKCENEQQWDNICELSKANSKGYFEVAKNGLFDLRYVGNYWSVSNENTIKEQGYQILTYSELAEMLNVDEIQIK